MGAAVAAGEEQPREEEVVAVLGQGQVPGRVPGQVVGEEEEQARRNSRYGLSVSGELLREGVVRA